MKRIFYITQGHYFADITAIQIQDYDRETEHFFIIERDGKTPIRVSKDVRLRSYYDSWEDAWTELKRRAERNIIDKQQAVTYAQRSYDEICKMTKPNYRPVGFR